MKAQEIQELEMDELAGKLKDSRRELYELRFKLAVGQLDDHRQIRKVRQDIARLLTFKRQRELGMMHAGVAVEASATATAPAAPAAPAATAAEDEQDEEMEQEQGMEAPAAGSESEPDEGEEQE